MKTEGLFVVAIGVKDLDKSVEFFSSVLGMEFRELTGPLAEKVGVRISRSLDNQIELISPVRPLKEGAPPVVARLARVLEDKDSVLFALTFRVKDTEKFASGLRRQGVRIEDEVEVDEFEVWSMRNVKELIVNEQDTLGILMSFVEYEHS